MKIIEQQVELLHITNDPEKEIERAGRICYKSEDKITDGSAAKFVEMILKRGHESVIEHASASFRIITDRGIGNEIVRHRLASYSQESSRYCRYSKNKFGSEITVIEPFDLTLLQRTRWEESCKESESGYLALINEGCTSQIARSVLPTCLKTEIVMTCNFREWRHFIKLRTSSASHPQIRDIAKKIHEILVGYSPACFNF